MCFLSMGRAASNFQPQRSCNVVCVLQSCKKKRYIKQQIEFLVLKLGHVVFEFKNTNICSWKTFLNGKEMRIQQVGLWRMDVRDAVEPCFSENGQVQSRLDCTDKMTTLSTPLHPAILACCAKVSSASHTLSLSLSLFLTLPVLGSSGSCVSSFCDHMLKPGEHSFAQETLKAWQLGEQFLRLTPKKMEVLLDSCQIYCWIPCFFSESM